MMTANTRKLHDLGQRLWLDNITNEMPNNGTLAHYIGELSVTGLTSILAISESAIGSGEAYEQAIHALAAKGSSGADRFFEPNAKASTTKHSPRGCDASASRHLPSRGVP